LVLALGDLAKKHTKNRYKIYLSEGTFVGVLAEISQYLCVFGSVPPGIEAPLTNLCGIERISGF
jgi:hypothetical protein